MKLALVTDAWQPQINGVGPLEAGLRERYLHVRWLGVLSRDVLAPVYAAAEVFVMPSRSETFGLVMLDAMATGTPGNTPRNLGGHMLHSCL